MPIMLRCMSSVVARRVIRCIAALRSLTEQSGQRSISVRTGNDVNDPKRALAVHCGIADRPYAPKYNIHLASSPINNYKINMRGRRSVR